MTHEELLKTINKEIKSYDGHLEVCKEWVALRAVVELHKPLNSLWYKQTICESCQEGNDYPITYPCETIQVIEKELA